MKRLIVLTAIAVCLTFSAGFNGVTGAFETKDQGEKMVDSSKALTEDKEMVAKKGLKIITEADVQKKAVKETEKNEMADKDLK